MSILNLGNDYSIDETDGGDLVIKHDPSGATFEYDSGNNAWKLGDPLNANENDISNVGALETDGVDSDYSYSVANYSSIQAALDAAVADGVALVTVPQGTYTETVVVPDGVRLTGASADDPSFRAGTFINPSDDNAAAVELGLLTTIENIRVQNNGSGPAVRVNGKHSRVENCYFDDNIEVDANYVRYLGNSGGSLHDITLASGTEQGVIDNNVRLTITDNGTNTIGDNS